MPPAVLPTTTDIESRSLYIYVNRSIGSVEADPDEVHNQDDVESRSLYLYVNHIVYGNPAGGEPLDQEDVESRSLYMYVNRIHDRDPTDVEARSLYEYVNFTDDEIFPWIQHIDPAEQYPGGQVAIHGDGFGDTQAQEASSVKVGNYDPTIPGPGVDMGVVSWLSRSPNLHPANSGVATEPAIVVTVPAEAESGMLSVEETT